MCCVGGGGPGSQKGVATGLVTALVSQFKNER